MFCGGGGSSRGAAMAGATPVAALDMWKKATETYKLNFPNVTIYRRKVKSLTPRKVIGDVGKIDLLLASPECTNHSIARGNKPKNEDSRATAFEVVRFLKIMKPRWFIVENVMQMKQWDRFTEWHEKIRAIGYKTSIGILDAKYFGTPQSRRRLFVVGDLKNQPHLPKKGSKTTKTVADILGRGDSKKAPWQFSPVHSPTRAKATIRRTKKAINKLEKTSGFIMVYYGTDGAGGFQTLDRPLRTITTVDRFAYVRKNGSGYEMRMLQPPELAAAMGFPAYHKWAPSTRRERIKLIGNAVCPLVMRSIVNALTNE